MATALVRAQSHAKIKQTRGIAIQGSDGTRQTRLIAVQYQMKILAIQVCHREYPHQRIRPAASIRPLPNGRQDIACRLPCTLDDDREPAEELPEENRRGQDYSPSISPRAGAAPASLRPARPG
jgi:hypothetical protein